MRPTERAWTPALEAELRMLIRREYACQLQSIRQGKCAGKIGFDSVARANEVARRPGHEGMSIYRCKFCNHWHLGQPSMSDKRRRRSFGRGVIERDRARELEAELNGGRGRVWSVGR